MASYLTETGLNTLVTKIKGLFASHTTNTSNPHEVTKTQLGLGSVENKSSETIRNEITSENIISALGYTPSSETDNSDTKNTTGSTDTANKIYLVGALTQEENPVTYSHDTVYVGADGCLYSNGVKVSDVNHTHNYAGSSSAGGAANSANKLNTNAGSATQPVYFKDGIPVATTYTLGKSVPSNAVFTDTTYSNFVKSGSGAKAGLVPAPSTTAGTTKYLREDGTWVAPPNTTYSAMTAATSSVAGKAGLVPAPAAGKQASFLRGDGTWVVPTDTKYTHPTYTARTGVPTANQTPAFGGTFNVSQPVSDATGHITAVNSITITIPNATATTSAAGLMSKTDKSKLNGIATGANAYVHPTTSGNKHIPSGGSSGQILRWNADGTAVWGAETDTNDKVEQVNGTSDITRRLLLSNSEDDTKETDRTVKSANFTANPGTGALYAKGFDKNNITGKTLDLDTLTLSSGSPEAMLHIEKTNGGAANITNTPVANVPFILTTELIRWVSATDYITKQTFVTTNRTYRRTCTSGTWGTWTNVTVAKAVPSNAVFTDTTYSAATTSAAGLMSASDKTKLNGIATGANKTTIAANLTTTAAGYALDATMGKTLNDYITTLQNAVKNLNYCIGKFKTARYMSHSNKELGEVKYAYIPYAEASKLTTSNKIAIKFTDDSVGVFNVASIDVLSTTVTWLTGTVPYVSKTTIQNGTNTLAINSKGGAYAIWDDELYKTTGDVKNTMILEISSSSGALATEYRII